VPLEQPHLVRSLDGRWLAGVGPALSRESRIQGPADYSASVALLPHLRSALALRVPRKFHLDTCAARRGLAHRVPFAKPKRRAGRRLHHRDNAAPLRAFALVSGGILSCGVGGGGDLAHAVGRFYKAMGIGRAGCRLRLWPAAEGRFSSVRRASD